MRRISAAIVCALFLAGCGNTARPAQITYEVIGEGIGAQVGTYAELPMAVQLTYTNATGGIEQRTATTPWRLSFPATPRRSVSVSAQKQEEVGRVTCRIRAGDRVIQEATSDTPYGVASCSGQSPQ
jgi:hypothetical protein